MTNNAETKCYRYIDESDIFAYVRPTLIEMACDEAESNPDAIASEVLDQISVQVMVTVNNDGTYNIHEDEIEARELISSLTPAGKSPRDYYQYVELGWLNTLWGDDNTFSEIGWSALGWGQHIDVFKYGFFDDVRNQLEYTLPLTPEMEKNI